MTLRIRIDLSYDGTAFSGWAAQPGRRTVEGTLSDALTTLLRSPTPVRLVVAGRTDAGVHARGQVRPRDVDPAAWERCAGRSGRPLEEAAATRLRGILPADMTVRRVARAPEGFDARFSALRRRYLYRICDDPARCDPLRRHDTVLRPRPARRRAHGPRPPAACWACTTSRPSAGAGRAPPPCGPCSTTAGTARRDGTVEATVVADAFCHSMVRALVGAVVPVGEGRLAVDVPARGARRAGSATPGCA